VVYTDILLVNLAKNATMDPVFGGVLQQKKKPAPLYSCAAVDTYARSSVISFPAFFPLFLLYLVRRTPKKNGLFSILIILDIGIRHQN